MARYTFADIESFHQGIANAHKQINGFYGLDLIDFTGSFRSGVQTPTLLLETHDADPDIKKAHQASMFPRNISFVLVDFAGKKGDTEKRKEVLDRLEHIVLDILAYLKNVRETKNHPLVRAIQLDSFHYEKVGPVFDNMYGWNVVYSINPPECFTYEPDKWEWAE